MKAQLSNLGIHLSTIAADLLDLRRIDSTSGLLPVVLKVQAEVIYSSTRTCSVEDKFARKECSLQGYFSLEIEKSIGDVNMDEPLRRNQMVGPERDIWTSSLYGASQCETESQARSFKF